MAGGEVYARLPAPRPPENPGGIPGLLLYKQLLDDIEAESFLSDLVDGKWTSENANQAIHYGPLPPWAHELAMRLPLGCLPPYVLDRTPLFDQLIVNTYLPGQGIASHVDLGKFEDGIAVFSFGSSAVMDFAPAAPGPNRSLGADVAGTPTRTLQDAAGVSWVADALRQSLEVLLEPGDLLVLHGEARYCWTHGIQARMEDVFGGVRRQRGTRVSVTLRRMVGAARETGSEEHGAPRTLESVRL